MDELKKQVGYASVDYIKDGMTVGLGTGSTAYYMVEKLSQKVQDGELDVRAVTTSQRTAEHAQSFDVPLCSLNDVDHIDLTIDGADEVDPQLQAIKGGGGAHLLEKIVAYHSERVIWIVDESKLVDQLGAFPLAVEVIPSAYRPIQRDLNQWAQQVELRLDEKGEIFKTDHSNYILDLQLGKINQAEELARQLNAIPGVVEHGLFLDMADLVLVGKNGQVQQLEKN